MKVYYDNNKENIVINGVGRYFANGSLEAINDNGLITIRDTTFFRNEIHLDYTVFLKENGDAAGGNINDVIDYLNTEFNKKNGVSGDDSFDTSSPTKVVTNNNIREGDTIVLNFNTSLNEFVYVSNVANNSFTVSRLVSIALTGLTSNLPFRWRRI